MRFFQPKDKIWVLQLLEDAQAASWENLMLRDSLDTVEHVLNGGEAKCFNKFNDTDRDGIYTEGWRAGVETKFSMVGIGDVDEFITTQWENGVSKPKKDFPMPIKTWTPLKTFSRVYPTGVTFKEGFLLITNEDLVRERIKFWRELLEEKGDAGAMGSMLDMLNDEGKDVLINADPDDIRNMIRKTERYEADFTPRSILDKVLLAGLILNCPAGRKRWERRKKFWLDYLNQDQQDLKVYASGYRFD